MAAFGLTNVSKTTIGETHVSLIAKIELLAASNQARRGNPGMLSQHQLYGVEFLVQFYYASSIDLG